MKSDGIQRAVRSQRHDRSAGDAPNLGRVSRMPGTGMPRVIQRRRRGERKQAGTWHTGKHRHVLVWSILVALVAFFALTAAILFWLRPQMENVVKQDSRERDQSAMIVTVKSKFPSPSETAAVTLVRQGLAARDPADVAACFRIEDVPSEGIISFLGNLEATDGKLDHLVWLSSMDANGISIDGVLVYLKNGNKFSQRLALLTPNSEGVWKIDFDAFARTANPSWGKLSDGKVDHAVVRVMLSPDTYYNGFFRDDKKWLCYSMSSPEAGRLLLGYCKVSSPQALAIKSIMNKGNKSERATVEIRRVTGGSEKQFEITAVLAEDWVLTDSPFENNFK